MIDSNAIANLQMLMNTGDGRQAVLSELLQAEKFSESSSENIRRLRAKLMPRHGTSRIDAAKVSIWELRDHCIRFQAGSPAAASNLLRLTDRIIQRLDKLSLEDKESLIDFAEGFAYHYNNLFMAIMGHVSIVMFKLRPSHPSYGQLRECEELIHNTALLIRLMVDVFNRPQRASATVYPIDLNDIEIGYRIFSTTNKLFSSANITEKDLNVQKILKIVAYVMAKRMKMIFQILQTQTKRVFSHHDLCRSYGEHYRQIKNHLRRGMRIADALLEFNALKHKMIARDCKAVFQEALA